MDEVVHSDLCATSIFKEKCKDCRRAHNRCYNRRYRQKLKDLNIKTRKMKENNISVYNELFCDNCKGKPFKNLCGECKGSYKCAKSKKYKITKKNKQSKIIKESKLS